MYIKILNSQILLIFGAGQTHYNLCDLYAGVSVGDENCPQSNLLR